MKLVLPMLLSATLIVSAACGAEDGARTDSGPTDSGVGDGATAPAPLGLEQYFQELAVAECESVAVCPETVHRPYPADIGLAMGRGCALFVDADSNFRRLLASGRVTLDPAFARSSIEAVRSCTFGEPLVELALRGTQEVGAECESNLECVSRTCAADETGCRTCAEPERPPAALGESCYEAWDCVQAGDSFVACDRSTVDARTCAATTTAALGESCDPITACALGSFCASDNHCREPLAIGEACGTSDRCERGSMCSNGASTDQSTCIAVELLDEGASCNQDSFTLSDTGTFSVCDADQSLFCMPDTGICTKLSRAAPGAACQGRGGCEREFFCDDSRTCAVLRGDGEACASSGECEHGLCRGDVCVAVGCEP